MGEAKGWYDTWWRPEDMPEPAPGTETNLTIAEAKLGIRRARARVPHRRYIITKFE